MRHLKIAALLIVALAAILVTLTALPPLPQDPRYHHFSDSRTLLGIPHALNVLSNLALVAVGILGGLQARPLLKRQEIKASAVHYLVFFAGVFLTGWGSLYYHLAPSNDTLVWDRLPMTAITIGFFSAAVSELVSPRAALVVLVPLLLVGFGSVIYWHHTESLGRGDLRLYALVQFLPVLLTVLVLIMFKSPAHYVAYVIALLVFYALSRGAELLDAELFNTLGVVSGHTLKHLLAAAGLYSIVRMLKRRL